MCTKVDNCLFSKTGFRVFVVTLLVLILAGLLLNFSYLYLNKKEEIGSNGLESATSSRQSFTATHTILMWTDFKQGFDVNFEAPLGPSGSLYNQDVPADHNRNTSTCFQGCFITSNRSFIHSAQIVLFSYTNIRMDDLPLKVSQSQIWALVITSPPQRKEKETDLEKSLHLFDILISYYPGSHLQLYTAQIEPIIGRTSSGSERESTNLEKILKYFKDSVGDSDNGEDFSDVTSGMTVVKDRGRRNSQPTEVRPREDTGLDYQEEVRGELVFLEAFQATETEIELESMTSRPRSPQARSNSRTEESNHRSLLMNKLHVENAEINHKKKTEKLKNFKLVNTMEQQYSRIDRIRRAYHYDQRLVATIQNKCTTPGNREGYLAELRHHVPVHVYGDCGVPCPGNSTAGCLNYLQRFYKFFLVFEESICEHYISDLVWQVYQTNMLPVVFGGADYSDLLPVDSHVDALSLSPDNLAHFLLYLNDNDNIYRDYFQWKEKYRVVWKDWKCQLCGQLNQLVQMKLAGSQLSRFSSLVHTIESDRCTRWPDLKFTLHHVVH